MSATLAVDGPSKARVVAAWVIQVLLAVAYLAAAGAKMAGVPMMVGVFATIGLGQWFRYVTALVELSGVVMLLVPGFAGFAAIWLGFTMICAVGAHLFVLHTSPAGAVVLLVLNAVLLWLRRDQVAGVLGRLG